MFSAGLASLRSLGSFRCLRASLFIYVFLSTAGIASAQNLVGLVGGMQFASVRYELLHQPQPQDRVISPMAGVQMKVPFDINLYFVPALRYQLRGYDVQLTIPNSLPDVEAVDNSVRLHGLEFAFLLQYDLGKTASHAFIRFGPSLDAHLFGKERFLKSTGEIVSRSMSFARGEYGKYTANLLGEIGWELRSGWFVYGHYTYGGTNLSNRDYGPSIKLRSFGISLGKYLNGKKIQIDTRNVE